MIGVLIITHGNLGDELIKTAEMIKGDTRGIIPLSLDAKTGVEDIKKKITSKKMEQAKLEQRLEDLTTEKDNLDKQMAEAGIKDIPSLETEIESLEKELTEGLEKCQKMLA